MSEIQSYTFVPDDRRPVTFKGTFIDSASSKQSGDDTRWTDLSAYRTEGGTLVLYVKYRTQWQGEQDSTSVHTFTTAEELVTFLEEEYPFAAPEIADTLGIVQVIP